MRLVRDNTFRVDCDHCQREIEGCDGAYGIWMHTATRLEHCATGEHLAEPARPTADRGPYLGRRVTV